MKCGDTTKMREGELKHKFQRLPWLITLGLILGFSPNGQGSNHEDTKYQIVTKLGLIWS